MSLLFDNAVYICISHTYATLLFVKSIIKCKHNQLPTPKYHIHHQIIVTLSKRSVVKLYYLCFTVDVSFNFSKVTFINGETTLTYSS